MGQPRAAAEILTLHPLTGQVSPPSLASASKLHCGEWQHVSPLAQVACCTPGFIDTAMTKVNPNTQTATLRRRHCTH